MPKPVENWKRLHTDAAFRERMKKRSQIIAGVRNFFADRDFLEVETPTVVSVPGTEPHLDPFITDVFDYEGRKHEAHLITSPEYAMKKLLAGGLPRIFEIARCYRNGEPWDGSHNPEFSMLEWYRADADYTDIMADIEQMVSEVAARITGSRTINYGGRRIDLSAPWPRMTVKEAMATYAGIDLDRAIDDEAWFRQEVENKGCPTGADDTFDDLFFRIFLRDVEPKLGVDKPVILCEYPRSMAALARMKEGDQRYAERFEAYCGGMELANAFSELNDGAEQRRRLDDDLLLREQLGKHTYSVDEQFLEAVGQMPKAGGIALGIDRLVMLLTDASTIRDVLFFPAGDLFE